MSFNSRHKHFSSSVRSLHLLAFMATPLWKTFAMDAGKMQRRRHHMTARSLALWFSSFITYDCVFFIQMQTLHNVYHISANYNVGPLRCRTYGYRRTLWR